jgi:mitochondrial fission protein ELM1
MASTSGRAPEEVTAGADGKPIVALVIGARESGSACYTVHLMELSAASRPSCKQTSPGSMIYSTSRQTRQMLWAVFTSHVTVLQAWQALERPRWCRR